MTKIITSTIQIKGLIKKVIELYHCDPEAVTDEWLDQYIEKWFMGK